MRCPKHDEETAVSCGRCETPVCPRCMVHTDVGVRCPGCAPDARGRPARKSVSVLFGAVVAIAVIVAIGTVGSGSLSGSDDKEIGDYRFDVDATRAVDPWTGDESSAAAGRRFVAVEITLRNAADAGGPFWVEMYEFKLTDSEDFAYSPVDYGARPQFPEVTLQPGEKARGWITFEVAADNRVKSLTYWDGTDVPLP